MDGTVRSVQLRHAGAGFREDVHDGNIGLEGTRVQSAHLHISENGTGHQEGCRARPVRLNGKICRLIMLAALDAEIHARAQAPVLRFQEIVAAFHLGAYPDAEFLEHIHCYEQVRNAARLVDVEDRFFLQERQGSQEAAHQLRAAFAGDIGPAGQQRSRHLERQVAVCFTGCIPLRI